jgi:hypothetical protein
MNPNDDWRKYIVVKTDDEDNYYEAWGWKHIRPIPPKPKTLREEVEGLMRPFPTMHEPNLVLMDRDQLLAIIDRHEKGGENG